MLNSKISRNFTPNGPYIKDVSSPKGGRVGVENGLKLPTFTMLKLPTWGREGSKMGTFADVFYVQPLTGTSNL